MPVSNMAFSEEEVRGKIIPKNRPIHLPLSFNVDNILAFKIENAKKAFYFND